MPFDETLAAQLRPLIERAFADRALLKDDTHARAVHAAVDALSDGALRVATRDDAGWTVHPWLKQAILLYFALQPVERAGQRAAPRNALWLSAARHALADRELHDAAVVCFAAALEALPRIGATTAVLDAVGAYTERYVARGRCPADELIDRFNQQGKDVLP